MPHVLFLDRYEHTWPSRAMTSYPAGWSGSVKTEVATHAISLGKAEKIKPDNGELADGEKSQ